MTDTIQEFEVLSVDECKQLRDLLFVLRPSWVKRHPMLPFYTLGAASYMDAVNDKAGYSAKATQYNPILQEHLPWLYDRIGRILAPALGDRVGYAQNLALPGFHIYLSSKVFEKPIASIHCDSQYSLHDWNYPDADLSTPISFTLSIALPQNGGGLNVWDIRQEEIVGMSPAQIGAVMNTRQLVYHSYRAGHLVLHSGHILHQAAPGVDVQADDERITLQGHGIHAGGCWQLYW